MKKKAIVLAGAMILALAGTPAMADTTIYFSNSNARRVHDEGRHYGHHKRHYESSRHARREWRRMDDPFFSVFSYAPSPRRTVILEKTIVQPVFVAQAPLLAAQPLSGDYVNGYGQVCREYQARAVVAGRTQNVYGTACLGSDGAWRVVE